MKKKPADTKPSSYDGWRLTVDIIGGALIIGLLTLAVAGILADVKAFAAVSL